MVEARLDAGGAFVIDLWFDFDALLLGLSPAAPAPDRLVAMESLRRAGRDAEAAAVARLSELLRRRLRARFDGEAVPFAIAFPDNRDATAGELVTLGGRVRLDGRAPQGARAFTFFASRSFRGVDLRVGVGERRSRQILEPGVESKPIPLDG